MDARALVRKVLNEQQRKRLHRLLKPAWVGVSRHTRPISLTWGADRGTPVGQWYDWRFLQCYASDIHGRVLEIRDKTYSPHFEGVTQIDVLDIDASWPDVTIVGDLTNMPHVPSDTYDCIILTRVLKYIRDVPAALREVHRVLVPGGVLLSAHSGVPGRLTKADPYENEFAILSPRGTATLYGEAFGADNITMETWGNVLACMAFLRGVSAEEVGERRLMDRDPLFPQTITVRAVKR